MTSPLPALPAAPSGVYRHYKGELYQVVGTARHSETLEPLVLYRQLKEPTTCWARPHAMFFGSVFVGEQCRARFEFLSPGEEFVNR